MTRRIRFTTRTLLATTFVVAVACALLTAAHRSFKKARGYGPLEGPANWPHALQKLIGDDQVEHSEILAYGLGSYIDFDHRSIWMIKGQSKIIEKLLATNVLQATDESHPMADRLLSSIPADWPRPDLSACSWQATPGFGQRHIEGVDLFLILRDETADLWFVLHHWNL